MLVEESKAAGFNPGIFDASIPMAAHLTRAATKTAQAEQLLKSGKAFSASVQWNFCESRIGNAGETMRAQKQQLELNETSRANVANKKNEVQLKTLQRHTQHLQSIELMKGSLTEKEDWGDVIRWVLPEAKVSFLSQGQ
jgi:hypothetical protein